ncbi:transcriptional regulator PpsR [Rhodobacter sp. SW2]
MLIGPSTSPVSPEMLSDIIATASDIAMSIDPSGRVLAVQVNPHNRSFGELQHWVGKPVNEVLTDESRAKLATRLEQLRAAPGGPSLAVEVNHVDEQVWEFPVRYTLHVLPSGAVLMLGRDLRQIAEMQQRLVNAQMALERDYESQREMDTRYRVLMEVTRDAVVVVSVGTGRIVDLNTAGAHLLGGTKPELMGAAIAQEFEGRRRGEFLESLTNLAVSDTAAPIDLLARRSQSRLLVTPTVFRAAGERLLLCRLESAAKVVAVQDGLSEDMARLFHEGIDGIVMTDRDGMITNANEAFLNLTDSSDLAEVRGRPFAEFLVRGGVDQKVLFDSARRSGRMRLYATKLITAFAGEIAAEISATWLNDRPNPSMVLVIRDASRTDSLRRPGGAGVDDGMTSVMDLVGSSTLKDIVAETTDVVEKLCIETAVQLTRNNRVAAAEMLGLSRQSLYVKLRKFGLVGRDGD